MHEPERAVSAIGAPSFAKAGGRGRLPVRSDGERVGVSPTIGCGRTRSTAAVGCPARRRSGSSADHTASESEPLVEAETHQRRQEGVSTMQMQRILAAGCFLALMLGAPALANAERSCISTVAGDTCLAQCIGNLQLDCGSDPACHQAVAAAIQMLASTPAGTDMCDAAVANARAVCECP
jgi:hypothetical protein